MARLVELIYTELWRGNGTEGNPARPVQQLWTTSGELVEEFDPITRDEFSPAWWELKRG